jgi:hypothetical protein
VATTGSEQRLEGPLMPPKQPKTSPRADRTLVETTEARHRQNARHFRHLGGRAQDPQIQRLLLAIADLHARIADRLAALKARSQG